MDSESSGLEAMVNEEESSQEEGVAQHSKTEYESNDAAPNDSKYERKTQKKDSQDKGKQKAPDGKPAQKSNPKNLQEMLAQKAEVVHDDSLDGAMTMVYYVTPEGEVVMFLHENYPKYEWKEERLKLRPVGGTYEAKDKTRRRAVIRELEEEIDNKKVVEHIIDNLSAKPVYSIAHPVGKDIATMDIFESQVTDPKIREQMKKIKLDGTHKYIKFLTASEIMGMTEDKFAFGLGPAIKDYARRLNRSIAAPRADPYNLSTFMSYTPSAFDAQKFTF